MTGYLASAQNLVTDNWVWKELHKLVSPSRYKSVAVSATEYPLPPISEVPLKAEMFPVGSAAIFVRLAGISGALAVGMGAYGSHGYLNREDVSDRMKQIYITANQYHFWHTLALLAVPLTRNPLLVGSLMTVGMSLFCGTCYYYCLTGHEKVVKFTPYGGTILILAWISMVL